MLASSRSLALPAAAVCGGVPAPLQHRAPRPQVVQRPHHGGRLPQGAETGAVSGLGVRWGLGSSLQGEHAPRTLSCGLTNGGPCYDCPAPPQIADFGLSTVLHDDGAGHLLTKTVVGTPNYMSPCVLQVREAAGQVAVADKAGGQAGRQAGRDAVLALHTAGRHLTPYMDALASDLNLTGETIWHAE